MADREDKTLAPTPRRRQQARDAGQVAKSQDLVSAVLLLGSVGLLVVAGGGLLSFLAELLKSALGGNAWTASLDGAAQDSFVDSTRQLALELGRRVLPLIGGAGLLAMASHLVQSGWLFLPARMLPDFSRLNPASGLVNVYSASNLARLMFGLGKVAVVAAVGLAGVWSRREAVIELAACDLPDLGGRAWELCLWSCLEMGAALLGLAALDYLYQRWRLEQELQMSPQELREEMRELQGDPRQAARRRELARRPLATAAGSESLASDRRSVASTPASIGAVDSIR